MEENIKNIKNIEIIEIKDIKNKIFTIRGFQVILDRDLADFYQIETRVLKQAVNRNLKRFPEDFCFKLTENEINFLVSQFVIPSKKHLGGSFPYVFTEQGVANLSSILSTEKAIEINIIIMRAFVQMRRFLESNQDAFKRLNIVETKLLEHDDNLKEIFKQLNKNQEITKGIFFDGQFFDSYQFVLDLIRKAKKEIILIDNYVDERTLNLFKKTKIKVDIYTKNITKDLIDDLEKYNSQYNQINLIHFEKSHDRFLIIDDETYHIGSSLKDLGKKWFAFSKIDITKEIKDRLKES